MSFSMEGNFAIRLQCAQLSVILSESVIQKISVCQGRNGFTEGVGFEVL